MFCRMFPPSLMAGVVGVATCTATVAAAHGFAGPRFFPATIATEDPFVADELALPTVAWFKDNADVRTTTYSVDFSKRITSNFGIGFGGRYVQLRPPGGSTVDGFDNFALSAKYQFSVDTTHETIFSIGIDADLGGTGTDRIGAEHFSTITPAFFFGKGFGDLADRTSMLRAFAVTGSIGVAIPTEARSPDGFGGFQDHPNTLKVGLALEYSFPYLQSQVRNVGLGSPLDRLILVTELSFQTPLDRGSGKTTGTVNPGLLWAGQYVQLSAEAIIPWNRDSGHAIGFLAQLHFYIDDIFPMSLGRPLIGG